MHSDWKKFGYDLFFEVAKQQVKNSIRFNPMPHSGETDGDADNH